VCASGAIMLADVVRVSILVSTGALANLSSKMGSFRKRTLKSAMQHVVEQNQDCQDQVAAPPWNLWGPVLPPGPVVGVGVALDQDLGPRTTTMTSQTCGGVAVGGEVAMGLGTHTLIPPAGKAHRSYTSLPHITILILLILNTVKTHRLHLCPHITTCVLVVVSVLMLLTMCRHSTHTTGKSHTRLTDPGASARAAHAKSIHDLMTHINPLD
jgi:hypothetical protein